MKSLEGRVAVVAGATRGAGRGIACGLGEAGAIVYCTGRSVRGKPAGKRPETIEETADMVTARGGLGLPVQVDHEDEAQVRALFRRIRKEQGKLDVLVNVIWGGGDFFEGWKPFWKLSPEKGFGMLRRAICSHILTSRWGVPLMIPRRQGLVVEITDGDGLYYRGNLFIDLCKILGIRLAWSMALELRKHNVTAVALTPGYLRSEEILDHWGVTEANWRDAIPKDPTFAESETPLLAGRAVAALAADPNVLTRSGKALATWSLTREYGLKDVDGRQPNVAPLVTKYLAKWEKQGWFAFPA